MDTHTYLNQYYKFDNIIRIETKEVERLFERAISMSQKIKDVDVQSSCAKDIMADSVAQIVDLQRASEWRLKKAIEKKCKIKQQIFNMDNVVSMSILQQKYIENLPWKSFVVNGRTYSKSRLSKLYEIALKEFEIKYGSEYL